MLVSARGPLDGLQPGFLALSSGRVGLELVEKQVGLLSTWHRSDRYDQVLASWQLKALRSPNTDAAHPKNNSLAAPAVQKKERRRPKHWASLFACGHDRPQN